MEAVFIDSANTKLILWPQSILVLKVIMWSPEGIVVEQGEWKF